MAEYNSESEVDIESSITTRSGRTLKVSNVTENTDRDIDGDEEEPTTPSVTTRSGMVVKVAIEAKNNTRDIDEDEDEKEPTTPVPSDTLSKETRKLRKKKQLTDASEEEQEYVSDEELSKIKSGKVAPSGQCVDDEDIDGVDTDDLLEEVDQLPRLRKTLQKKKRITRKTKTSRKRSKSSTPLIKPEAIKKLLQKKQPEVYDPEKVRKLAEEYPDIYWRFHADTEYDMIKSINQENTLEVLSFDISDQSAITGMTLSNDGTLLATFSNIGAVKVWDIQNNFKCVRKIRDAEETQIDEFYCGQFVSEDQELIVTAGKLKDRHRWSAEDGDSHILPCPIKIFRLEDCSRVARLEGHTEEILCVKSLSYMGNNYLISTSQDGYIIKWHMDETWTTLIESTPMVDGVTCMAFTISFVPNTGNRYFIAACDEHLRLYDFEQAKLLQTFEYIYSSYCDCGKFINWLDEDLYYKKKKEQQEQQEDHEDADIDIMKEEEQTVITDLMQLDIKKQVTPYAYFISRGAEMCDVSEGVSSKQNTCTLHKLIYPAEVGGKFELETVQRYTHEDYHSNSWLVKITSNGRYILAPTIYGQIFVFNMATGKVTAIIKEHQDIEVRDVIFHPYLPLIVSCGDDGYVKVYTYAQAESMSAS